MIMPVTTYEIYWKWGIFMEIISWIWDNRDGIIASIVAAIICWVIKKALEIIQIKKSIYSGNWEQLIYDNNDYTGEPIKRDIYKLKHKKLRYSGKMTVNIVGTISRVSPEKQKHRKWHVIGYLEGNILTMMYQAKEAQKSRGCIYVKLFADFEFRGYYLEEHSDGTIDKTPLIIKKKGK
ncbi:hypothetical protein [Blautia sp. HCP3S3_C4]|uniref:hypothetical protein n=1 Tax=Blautia sp. HCP3S3_C4 TaxID=3438911 RepID=UPI003F8A5732